MILEIVPGYFFLYEYSRIKWAQAVDLRPVKTSSIIVDRTNVTLVGRRLVRSFLLRIRSFISEDLLDSSSRKRTIHFFVCFSPTAFISGAIALWRKTQYQNKKNYCDWKEENLLSVIKEENYIWPVSICLKSSSSEKETKPAAIVTNKKSWQEVNMTVAKTKNLN